MFTIMAFSRDINRVSSHLMCRSNLLSCLAARHKFAGFDVTCREEIECARSSLGQARMVSWESIGNIK